SASGGEGQKLTTAKNSVQSFRWSKDGKQIAFLATDPRTDEEEKKQRDGDDQRVVDVDNKPVRIWTVDLATKAVKRISNGPWTIREFDWMPDGKRFLVSATDRPADDRRTERIYSVAVEEGKIEE